MSPVYQSRKSTKDALQKLYEDIKELGTYHNFLGFYEREDGVKIPAISYTPINPQWRTQGIECTLSIYGQVSVSKFFNNRPVRKVDIQISFKNHPQAISLAHYVPKLLDLPKPIYGYLLNNWGSIKDMQYTPLHSFGKSAFKLEQLDLILEVVLC